MSVDLSYLPGLLQRVLARLEGVASWRWAMVSGVGPLRVTPDGDSSPLVEAPDTLVAGLQVGDRVRIVTVANRTLVLGLNRGGDTGWVDCPPASSWTGSSMQVRRVGPVIYARGHLRKASGNVPASTLNTGVAQIPAGFEPPGQQKLMAVARVTNSIDDVARVDVNTTGAVDCVAQRECNHIKVDGLCWLRG